MDDVRLGQLLRAARVRRGWRQVDVAKRASVSRQTISRLERGQLEGCSLRTLRLLAAVLEVRLDINARWRGAEGERLLAARHSAMADAVSRELLNRGWDVKPEVSFSIFGERGVIDLLAWHAVARMLLVVELKTEIVDIGAMLGTLDRKRRLASRIAGQFEWRAQAVAVALIVAESEANRTRVQRHAAVLRAALPADGRTLKPWLRRPSRPICGLTFWADSRGTRPIGAFAPTRRVREESPVTGAGSANAMTPPNPAAHDSGSRREASTPVTAPSR